MARSGRSFDHAFLERLRGISLLDALSRLDLYWKFDPDLQPVRNANTRRLYVRVGLNLVELLLTDQKWCDPQGFRGYPRSICFCAEVQLACLHKTMSCEVKAAARRSIIDVVRVAAGALVRPQSRHWWRWLNRFGDVFVRA